MKRELFDALNAPVGVVLTECLCVFSVFRVLGFSADDIYLSAVKLDDGRTGVRSVLRAQGLEFIIDVGAVKSSPTTIRRLWSCRCEKFNATPPGPSWDATVRASSIYRRRMDLVTKLALKGFTFRPLPEKDQ